MVTSNYDATSHTLTCSFSGSMDTLQSDAAAGEVSAALNKAATKTAPADKPLRAVFDLKNVDYVSSAFFRICLGTAKQVRQGNFRIINARPAITQLFKIAGLDEFMAAL